MADIIENRKEIDFSKKLFILGVILVAGLVISWGVSAFINLWSIWGGFMPREITISAQGKAVLTPDIAMVRLGVSTEGTKVADIVKENNDKMNAILTELKASGIEDKDLKTTNYSLNPRYDYLETGQRVFRGYTLTQEVQVKVRDFAKIGDVLEKSTIKGSNLIGDLQFTIDDQTAAKNLALQDAISKAKSKADKIALESGIKLGRIVNVYEDFQQPIPYYSQALGMGGADAMLKAESTPQIQAGEQEIIATISLVYKIK